jgi:MOSC domain-containing protein YiiM
LHTVETIILPQADLPQDLGILSTVAKYNQVHVGVYASVEHGGIIRRGDTIRVEEKIKRFMTWHAVDSQSTTHV